jgi:hypothetical protein
MHLKILCEISKIVVKIALIKQIEIKTEFLKQLKHLIYYYI